MVLLESCRSAAREEEYGSDGYVPEKAHAGKIKQGNAIFASTQHAAQVKMRRRQRLQQRRLRCVCASLRTMWSSGRLEAWYDQREGVAEPHVQGL